MRKILVVLAAGLALAGCSEAPAKTGDSVAEIVYIYDGAPLHCVGWGLTEDGHAVSNGALLSCDFVRYHAENPEKLLSK